MNIRKVLALLLTLVLCMSALAGCGGEKPAAEEKAPEQAETTTPEAPEATGDNIIKVGLVFPTSGASASPGQINIWGITDYFQYYNEKGGIQSLGGAQIVWEVRDTESAADVAVSAAESVIGDESISAMMGTYNSGTMSAVQPVAAKYNMPTMGVNSVGSYCYVTENECVAHVVSTDQQDLPATADFYKVLKEEYGVETAMLALDNSELATNNRIFLHTAMERAGIEIIGEEVFNANASDFSTIVQKIKSNDPDFVVCQMNANDAVLFTQTMAEYDVSTLVQGMGVGFSDPTYLDAVGDLAENVLCSGYYFSSALDSAQDPELAKQFADKHKNERGIEINEPYAVGWTAAAVLVDAFERAASTDREAIAKALMETNIPYEHEANLFYNYPSITFEDFECENGDFVYNQNPNPSLMLAQYQDGVFNVVFPEASAVADVRVG